MSSSQPAKLDRMLRMAAVEQFSGLKKSSIYAGIKDGSFPAPVRLSARAVAWKESALIRWQQTRLSTSGAGE